MDKDIKSIEVRDLVKKFGDFTAVNDISFHVFKGEIFGFLGANGAGKTTAMRILCGLSHPTSGEGSVAGFSIVNEQEKIKKHIGYMSQKFSLYPDLKVWENIELFGGIYGLSDKQIAEKTESMLKALDMEKAKNMYVSDIPLGWKQKLAFSIAGARSGDRVPGRADRRCGPGHATQLLGTDLQGGIHGCHGFRHHALYGRGRVLRQSVSDGGRKNRGTGLPC